MNSATHTRWSAGTRMPTLVVCVVAAIVITAFLYYMRQSRAIETQRHAHGALLLDMAENGLRAHLRADHYHPEHLEDWFLGLMVSARLGGIRLSGAQQEMLALGLYQEEPHANTGGYFEIMRTLPALESLPPPRGWRRGGPRGPGQGMGPGTGRGMGPGMGAGMGWMPLPSGPYTFTLALEGATWREQRQALLAQTLFGVALAFACAGLLAALLLLRDRQLRLGMQLAAAEQQSRRQRMLAELGAGLAHETKNPLGLIRGLAQRIREQTALDKATRKRLSDIIDETDRVVGRIDSFLSLSKPSEAVIRPTPLVPLFAALNALLHDEAQAAGIALTLNAADLVVDADADLLRRALLNLLLNAFKACHRDGTVSVIACLRHGREATITVRDDGIGVAPEDLPRITTPYFSRFEGGVGLGLALTREIVEAHGWRLDFASQPGAGTEVTISGITPTKETP